MRFWKAGLTATVVAALIAGPLAPTSARANEFKDELDQARQEMTRPEKPVDFSHYVASDHDIHQEFIPPSSDGQYQLRRIGDKFAALFTADGEPLIVFDLSLNPLSAHEILLGGLGFGRLTVWNAIKAIAHAHKMTKKGNDPELEPSIDEALDPGNRGDIDDSKPLSGKDYAKALKRGAEKLKDLRFNADWAKRHGMKPDQDGVPFVMTDFTMADIQFHTPEQRKAVFSPLVDLAKLLYPDEDWNDENIAEFAREFEFRYDPKKPGYDIYWNQVASKHHHKPKLPGIVVNFIDPIANLAYKYQLRQFDQYGEILIERLGIPGVLMDLVLSNVVHALSERLDYHERQFLSLLEATERFEYKPDVPIELVDTMIDMVYLSRFNGSSDPLMTDGPGKRRQELVLQEEARKKTLKRLHKKHHDYQFQEIGGGKFAVAFSQKSGEAPRFRGIYSLGLKPTFFVRRPSILVNGRTAFWKLTERYADTMAGFLARIIMPPNLGFRLGPIFIGLHVPPAIYQYWIRLRMVHEQEFEGELAGLVDEAIAGRYQLPLSQDELKYSQKYLRTVFINPYELRLDEEKGVIEKNLALIKQLIANGSYASEVLSNPKNLVPYTL